MGKLAIKGHATRGSEVIELLGMLGGKNVYNLTSAHHECFYRIAENEIYGEQMIINPLEVKVFTLEEFIEKFPYKIGDKAIAFGNKCTIIDAVWAECIDEVVYTIKFDVSHYTTTKRSYQLQPYKEQGTVAESSVIRQRNSTKENTVMRTQVCTTIEQAKTLLKLGVKPQTADMYYDPSYPSDEAMIGNNYKYDYDIIPSWSLHRLIQLCPKVIRIEKAVACFEITGHNHVRYNGIFDDGRIGIYREFNNEYIFQNMCECFEWLIKLKLFSEEYLVG